MESQTLELGQEISATEGDWREEAHKQQKTITKNWLWGVRNEKIEGGEEEK